jgi:hypothetical protein
VKKKKERSRSCSVPRTAAAITRAPGAWASRSPVTVTAVRLSARSRQSSKGPVVAAVARPIPRGPPAQPSELADSYADGDVLGR